MLSAQTAVHQQTGQGQKQRSAEHESGKQVAFSAQRTAAHRGGQHGGQPPHGAQQQPGAPAYVRQPRKVAQQILRRARYGENEPKKEVPLGRMLEKVQFFQLFRREKNRRLRAALLPSFL